MIPYDDYKSPWENKDATVATSLRTITYSSDSDKKPAARKEPIQDTQTIKEPIKGPHLVNRVRHSMDGSTNMDPVLTGVGIIGQRGSWTISGGSHTQSIVQGGEIYNSQRRHHSCPDEPQQGNAQKRLFYVRST